MIEDNYRTLIATEAKYMNIRVSCVPFSHTHTQSRIIGAVRVAHSQLWETTLPVFSSYAPRKYDRRFGTPAIV